MADPIRTYQEIVAQLRAKGISPEQIAEIADVAAKAKEAEEVREDLAPMSLPPIRETAFSEPVEQLDDVLERLKRIEDKLDRVLGRPTD